MQLYVKNKTKPQWNKKKKKKGRSKDILQRRHKDGQKRTGKDVQHH